MISGDEEGYLTITEVVDCGARRAVFSNECIHFHLLAKSRRA